MQTIELDVAQQVQCETESALTRRDTKNQARSNFSNTTNKHSLAKTQIITNIIYKTKQMMYKGTSISSSDLARNQSRLRDKRRTVCACGGPSGARLPGYRQCAAPLSHL